MTRLVNRINARGDANKITVLVAFPSSGMALSESTELCSDSPAITKKGRG